MNDLTPVSKSLSVQVKALTDDADGNGYFEALLSTPDLDLEGDELFPDGWELPLPPRIPINHDHKIGVLSTVGSAVPTLDKDGNLRVEGSFASTPAGQEVRTLVREGHIATMSVEFLQYWREDDEGRRIPGKRTLTGGAFTPIPANPNAVVLSAKSALSVDDIAKRLDELTALVKSLVDKAVAEQAWNGSASRFTIEQWRESCLIGPLGDPENKSSYKLPVKEPNGDINRNAVHSAASVLAGGRGGVDAPADEIRSAAQRLVNIYRNDLDEEPPESLTSIAGNKSLSPETAPVAESADDSAALVAAVDSVDSRDLETRAHALALLSQAYLSE